MSNSHRTEDEPTALTPAPLCFYATSSGGTTLDQGEGGGNPFASSLVELLGRKALTFVSLITDLSHLTERKSKGHQHPDLPARHDLMKWQILPKSPTESRVALVTVFSNYSASGGASSLPGAERDAHRVAAALRGAGFETEMRIDPHRSEIVDILKAFAGRSMIADVALFYTTGHGVEVAGTIYLLPGDYPVIQKNAGLAEHALQFSELASVPRAKHANLVFYAGCRNAPFGDEVT